jgi:hypothetical protein
MSETLLMHCEEIADASVGPLVWTCMPVLVLPSASRAPELRPVVQWQASRFL